MVEPRTRREPRSSWRAIIVADSSGQGAGIGASEVPLVAAAPSATSVAGEQAASRSVVHAWNVLRIVAMLDIATFHLSQRYLFAGVGLPVFLLLSMSLPAMAPRSGDRRTFWRRRVARLTGPWAFWTLALATLNVVRAVRHGEPPLGWAEPKMLLQGVETHFWYLPFVTLAGGACTSSTASRATSARRRWLRVASSQRSSRPTWTPASRTRIPSHSGRSRPPRSPWASAWARSCAPSRERRPWRSSPCSA